MKLSYFKFIFNKKLFYGFFLLVFLFSFLFVQIPNVIAKDTNFGLRILSSTQTAPNGSGVVNLNNTTPQGVIFAHDKILTVNVTSDTTSPSLDYSSFITNGTGTIRQTTVNFDRANINIPDYTTVTSADTSWNKVMILPTVATVTLPETSGITKTLEQAIEIGFSGAKLSFNKGVRILFPDQKDKRVGYTRTGLAFTEITDVCSEDSQTVGDALPADGDCKINAGNDLAVWTKHFTKFATYQSSSNSTNNNGPVSAPVCNNTKPGSAPILNSAVTGINSVTLTWTKATNPVTYYLIAYGTSSNNLQFGNPNVGDQNTTSYTVNNLSGETTYYFKVKAVNNCMPGDYSNEMSAKPRGVFISSPAKDFINIAPKEEISQEQSITPKAKVAPAKEEVKEATPEQLLLFKDEAQTQKPTKNKFPWILIGGIVILFGAVFGLYLRFRNR